MQFASVFPDEEIVVSLIRQLSWTLIIALLPIDDPVERKFCIEMCKLGKWGIRSGLRLIKRIWKNLNKPDFIAVEFDHFRMNAGLTSFLL